MEKQDRSWSATFLLLWLILIFVTSSTVIRPRELYSIIRYLFGVSPESMDQFKLFWGAAWFVFVKGWHFAEFAILTILSYSFVSWFRGIHDNKSIWFAMIFSALYAVSDEWHQTFVAGRIGSVEDVGIDFLGVGAAGIFLAIRLRRAGAG